MSKRISLTFHCEFTEADGTMAFVGHTNHRRAYLAPWGEGEVGVSLDRTDPDTGKVDHRKLPGLYRLSDAVALARAWAGRL